MLINGMKLKMQKKKSIQLWTTFFDKETKNTSQKIASSTNAMYNLYPNSTTLYYRDTCSSVFITVVLVIARYWKQLRCPSAGAFTHEKAVHLQNRRLFSCLKKKEIQRFTVWDSRKITLSELAWIQKGKYYVFSSMWMLVFKLLICVLQSE